MQRSITGFGTDDAGDWYAYLGCGHRQHVRHRPPFTERPWVMTEAGREARLGTPLECLRCDRFELPEGLVAYRSTPVFDQDSIPPGLLRDHTTKAGIWGRIVVEEGVLRYHVNALATVTDLRPGTPGTVVPEVPHRVEPLGPARFRVEFLKRGQSAVSSEKGTHAEKGTHLFSRGK